MLPGVHRSVQVTPVNQVRQGILAEKLRFRSLWLTEHHFQPKGANMSPNPLMVQMSVAAHTKRIRLGQAANIVVRHHLVWLADLGCGRRTSHAVYGNLGRRRHLADPYGRVLQISGFRHGSSE
jgi:hypothetical protein